jgi:electron transport complex protein RnfG
MNNMLKLGLVLALYAVVACTGLAVVYSITGPAIAAQQEIALKDALKEIFPQADGFSEITAELKSSDPKVIFLSVYMMKKNGAPTGVAVKAQGPSYGGPSVVLAGIGLDKKVTRIKVLENKDTPGLGAQAMNPAYFVDRQKKLSFTGQFAGKAVSDPFEVKQDVQIITASTITSRAIAVLVKQAGEAAVAWLVRTGGAR